MIYYCQAVFRSTALRLFECKLLYFNSIDHVFCRLNEFLVGLPWQTL